MSGTPPLSPPKTGTGEPPKRTPRPPDSGDGRNQKNSSTSSSSSIFPPRGAGRLRLPPPLPPVKGTGTLAPPTGAGTVPAPSHPPLGRLAPLQRNLDGAEGSAAARQSPPPRNPGNAFMPFPGEVPEVDEGGNEHSNNTAGSVQSSQAHVNPLSPSREQQQQQQQQQQSQSTPPRKPTETAGTSSTRSRVLMTPSASQQEARTKSAVSGEEAVEVLCPLQTQTRPTERFFVEFNPGNIGGDRGGGVEVDEDALLFDRFAEYTDDDSFFSSGSCVLEQDPRRLQKDLFRERAVRSVFDTLNLRALTRGRTPQELEDSDRGNASWMFQVHQRAVALHHSSFFVFPPGMKARVVAYNVMHHWLMEFLIILIILGYSIFTASWARYTAPESDKPDFMVFADVFYTVIYGIEILVRMFASGFVLHPRAYFRSPWHWLDTAVFVLMVMNCTYWRYLWNFTAFRLIRVIKACTYLPFSTRIKLLAKSVLRSTCKLFQTSVILVYVLFFFALMGLQLFRGALHHRCVNSVTGVATAQLCRPAATGDYWFYWGHTCESGYLCVADASPNPHYGFRSFDDVGHALLSTFQIMTFQGWTSLLVETNDAVNTLAILYYVFTILFCAWFIPGLYIGVFIEKIEKTSRLFVQKQLQLFDSMLLEQRQRMTKAIKLHDFVERDESGRLRRRAPEEVSGNVSSRAENVGPHAGNGNNLDAASALSSCSERNDGGGGSIKRRTKWTDEQRVQLHLSLTRQRDIAEKCNRKRRVMFKADDNGVAHANGGVKTSSQSAHTTSQMEGGDFALGGRVGMVQHHPLTYTIGASHGSKLPLAIRLENEQGRLQFLRSYQNLEETEETSPQRSAPRVARGIGGGTPNAAGTPFKFHASPMQRGGGHVEESGTSIIATRESAGVIPNRRSVQARANGNAESPSSHTSAYFSAAHDSVAGASQPQELLINDPEGGDFRYATTCGQRWGIIRNILHMFTEGYPRILTQYLWEHKRMQRRFGLLPLNYVNKYEEAALRKLRQKRARRGKLVRQNDHLDESGTDDYSEIEGYNNEDSNQADVGRFSPINMAKNIVENARVTVFNWIMLFLVFANGVFNASRHYGQPNNWDDGLFVAGVCFTSLFMLELIIRIIALGPGPFVCDFFNVLCLIVTVIGFFELGFGHSNSITVLNWVRFLRLLRIAPFAPMRRVTRVLLLGFQDIVYALIFFSVYMFMWILIGMAFFGGRMRQLVTSNDDYRRLGSFDIFSDAAFAVSQAFSYDRDEWLYLSWDGMRARGGYTIMYFLAVVGVAFIFRYLFIAVFAWAWQQEEESEDYAPPTTGKRGPQSRGAPRLRWFDFTVWRSFKHIHGGFERRDVAPDEVFHLNQDMRQQLRIAEAKERFSRESVARRGFSTDPQQVSSNSVSMDGNLASYVMADTQPPQVVVPQFVNVGGQLQRQMSMPSTFEEPPPPPVSAPISQFQAENAQLRFARRYSAVPATAYHQTEGDELHAANMLPLVSTPSDMALQNSTGSAADMAAELEGFAHPQGGRTLGAHGVRGSSSLPNDRHSSVTGHFTTLGYEKPTVMKYGELMEGRPQPNEPEEKGYRGNVPMTGGGIVYEHILLPGPRLRYKHVMVGRRRRVFERCLDCNTHKQMPLRAPPNVQQRTPDELHAEHCHMAAVRSSRQLVLNTIIGYVRLQKELGGPPTREAVETVLGQAWSCGMLLFDSIEYLSCSDIEVREYRTWDRTLEALQLQQWLIGLHVGEEQVGRATLAYILAHQKTQERAAAYSSFHRSWRDRSFFIFSPSNPLRRFVTAIVESSWFEWLILAVIFAAAICLCFYDPRVDTYTSGKYVTLHVLDDIFAVIFAVEMVLKWISMGVVLDLHVAYFWRRWNIFDCFITVVSLIAFAPAYAHFRYLKVMRCFRILGPLRYCSFNRELSKLALTMWDSVPTLANVLLLSLLNYIVWSILAVRLFMGLTHSCTSPSYLNKTSCVDAGERWIGPQRNFDNFYESLLTMFEVSTGSQWLDVIYQGVDGWSTESAPIANRHPSKGLFFIAYYYVSHLVLFSLFAASLIYCYLLAKNAAEDVTDITFEHQLWMRMQRMILRLKPRVALIPLGNSFSRFLHRIVVHPLFEVVMACILFFNLITMSLYWYDNSSRQENALDALQYVWVALFTVEILMRLAAHGLRAFSRWSFSFNVFVTCLSYLQIGLNTTVDHHVPFNVNVLRLLHLGRMLKLVDFLLPLRHHLHLLHEALLLSASSLVNVTLILALAVFVFAVLGMHLIGPVVPVPGGYIDGTYNNFLTFPNALMMVFRLATLEDWVAMLRASVADGNPCPLPNCKTTNWAPVFYVPIVICFALMIVHLYLAVLVDHYVAVARMKASVTRMHDLRRFRDLWSVRDPNARLVLRTKELPELLEALRPPLGLASRNNRVELMRLLREYGIPDHGGKVYYYEVMLPLARRVLAMAFSEEEVNDGTTLESVWRHSESFLRALPTVLVRHASATTAQHFAASYVQAAYRRDKACRQMHQLRANLWREARIACDEHGLPYRDYGFGGISLEDDDPREEAARRGLSIDSPEGKRKQKTAADVTAAAAAAATAGRSASSTRTSEESVNNQLPAARLPGLYQPAIDEKEKRFGPEVPNAVRRHETRSDKLRRKEEERQQQHDPLDRQPSIPAGPRPSAQRAHSTDYQPPLGTDPSAWLQSEIDRRMSATGPTSASAMNVAGTGSGASQPQATAPPS
ncbi:putative calcium channel protein [Trypanosoma conorhini]|uniref:Putative calcium channel protein n=1 Tax=Trypanosoma conorhini TaxID=83891 RepID=A0A422Q3W7_9TRYP|nr:putative calcium channel protein [Trypanosoma conorhini]RNF24650.1 putative calcium channel protein [Trypanosoma conorhini]